MVVLCVAPAAFIKPTTVTAVTMANATAIAGGVRHDALDIHAARDEIREQSFVRHTRGNLAGPRPLVRRTRQHVRYERVRARSGRP